MHVNFSIMRSWDENDWILGLYFLVRLFINEEDLGNKDRFGWGNLRVLFRTYNVWDASEESTLDLWIWSTKSPAYSLYFKAGHWPKGQERGERGKPSWAASFNACIGVNWHWRAKSHQLRACLGLPCSGHLALPSCNSSLSSGAVIISWD